MGGSSAYRARKKAILLAQTNSNDAINVNKLASILSPELTSPQTDKRSGSVQEMVEWGVLDPENSAVDKKYVALVNSGMGPFQAFSKLTDEELSQFIDEHSDHDLPDFLKVDEPNGVAKSSYGNTNIIYGNETQSIIYAMAGNDKAQELSPEQFDKYLKDNNIKRSDLIAHSFDDSVVVNEKDGLNYKITGEQIKDYFVDNDYNVLGGRHGGSLLGFGSYFAMNGGENTGYGKYTMVGALKPSAKIINSKDLEVEFEKKFPNTSAEIYSGGKYYTVAALALGYDAVESNGNYNVINRSAVVIRKGLDKLD